MKYADLYACLACEEVFQPRAGEGACPSCKSDDTRPLRRALLEGRKLDDLPDLLTEEEFAWWLDIELPTLRNWRYEGLIPSYVRVGRDERGPVRYTHQDIRNYINSRRVGAAS